MEQSNQKPNIDTSDDALLRACVELALPYEALLMDHESRRWIAPEIWKAIETGVATIRSIVAARTSSRSVK